MTISSQNHTKASSKLIKFTLRMYKIEQKIDINQPGMNPIASPADLAILFLWSAWRLLTSLKQKSYSKVALDYIYLNC
jgi:hypothetical protein